MFHWTPPTRCASEPGWVVEKSLPVIVDEILVNFDPDRTRRAAAAFSDISRTNQVLVFTCHPAMVEAFQAACPDAQLIEIDSLR